MTGQRRRLLRQVSLFGLALTALLAAHWVFTSHPMGLEIANTRWGMNIRHYAKFLEQVPRSVQRQADEAACVPRDRTVGDFKDRRWNSKAPWTSSPSSHG